MSLEIFSPIGTIHFSDNVIDLFNRHKQRWAWSPEGGGQLFCQFVGNVINVVEGTEPGRVDKCSRYSFWPSRRKEQREINDYYSRGLHYIGDWHTHPQNIPSPSPEDANKLKDIFRNSQHQLKYMLLVVVGRNDIPTGIWIGLVNSSCIKQLTK